MSYSLSINFWDKVHQRDTRTGFIVSVSLHALLFIVSGTLFVKTARFNVQPVPQSTTVELIETIPPQPVIENMAPPKPVEKHVEIKKTQPLKIQKIESQVIRVKANPDYFQNPAPEYPELAKQMQQEGLVLLSVDVDRTGYPLKIEMIKSSGFPLLDQAALKAVRHWKFQPGSIGNVPIESTVNVPIRFRLVK